MNSQIYDDIFQQHSDCDEQDCTFMENFENLRKSSVFSGTSLNTLKLFAYFFKTRYYKKNELILKQGERIDSTFFIIEGEVETYHDIDGNKKDPFVFQKMGPLSVFGELALLARFESFFNVIACTDVKLISLDRTSFQKVISKFPDKHNDLVERIVQLRLKRYENQLSSIIQRLRQNTDNKNKT